ncbi:C2 domain-containing protein 3-like [Gigantopelta aegis]|uniref:C2 domain-containing protein 3-like n=1 Tax=Gigantopelta aegis TaxID=1735272 RepID=UPI001B889DA0|nr:C2 domain-containing protein 3-like [Gigantopelta aegis]
MVKKKTKSSKTPKKRGEKWLAEDVKVHTALPPQVDGQLRCFCKVTVGQILWLTTLSPDLTLVRIKWWGEHGEGSIFKPLDVKKGEKGPSRTTARYPVRSGPRQFAAYLDDMGSMCIDVLSGPMSVPIGQAQVTEIGLLSNNRPINGFFPVFSNEEEKIAEIHVSVMLEPLMASYDSMGSIPTTDVSIETFTTQDSAYPQRVLPTPHHQQPVRPEQDPFISPASHQADDNRSKTAPYGEDLRQRLRYDADHQDKGVPVLNAGSMVSITANGDVVTTHAASDDVVSLPKSNGVSVPYTKSQHNVVPGEHSSSSRQSQPILPREDLLSVLLDKGKKLRDAMVISTLHNANDFEKLKDIKAQEIKVPMDFTSSVSKDLRSSNGSLFKEILHEEPRVPSAGMSQEFSMDLDTNTVGLAVGSPIHANDFKNLKMVNGLSPGTSLSSVDDIFSELEDPIQEESILNELFYNRSNSEQSGLSDCSEDERSRLNTSIGSLEHPGNARPPSRHSSMSSLNVPFPEPEKKKKKSEKSAKKTRPYDKPWRRKMKRPRSRSRSRSRSRLKSKSSSRTSSASELSDGEMTSRSETSRVSFDMTPSDVDEPVHDTSQSKLVDGLSVERLTLLGRVHVARVTVDSLDLLQKDLDTSRNSRKSDKVKPGRPPRPAPKTKKSSTYFLEYQFPVVATSRDKYSPNTMATEVMRVASKNVKNGVVSFNHRSVFPIMFDGSSIEKWWKSALVFKIFSREPGQKIPSPVGSCGVPLKSILKSESLCVNRDIEVREGNRNTSLSGSFKANRNGLFGYLKLTVELASDHKEFATAMAKTKLAELTGKVKIVPVVAPPQRPPPPPAPRTAALPQAVGPVSSEVTFPRGIEANSGQTNQHVGNNINNNHMESALTLGPLPSAGTQTVTSCVNTMGVQNNFNQSANPIQHSQMSVNHIQRISPVQSVQQFPSSQPNIFQSQTEALTLHLLLMIPEGRNIGQNGVPPLHLVHKRPMLLQHQPHMNALPGVGVRDVSTRNIYLVCRMFWCNDEIRSSVCWGTPQPEFNFTQVVPVLITPSLMERMRNNFMVIEVWDKKTTAEADTLVGMVKLSLHQFYLSFKDVKIATALLKSQFPVIGTDNFLAVTNPFTSFQFGQLRILLAMGSAEQVASLQRLKLNGDAISSPERPSNFLERQDICSSIGDRQQNASSSVEHVFEVVIEEIRGLQLFENMIWGEADAFVQYHFPTAGQQNDVKHVVPTMRSYRTATTLCIPDLTFHDVTRHRIVLPQGTPVQRELLTACSNSGGGIGGLPFEVWCRHYHPNVRDQVIAKATLPLAKLCAMVTMQKRGEPSTQAFSLPLSQVAMEKDRDTEVSTKVKDSGLVDITIHYKTNIVHNEPNVKSVSASLNSSHVCISVGVIRASGLKTAAENIARLDSGMQYPAEVGVNAYVSIRLSFLSKEGERHTKTIARTFAPEFSYYMDFPCPLLWTDTQTDGQSLAEILQSAEATFELWHQIPGTLAGPVGQYVATGSEEVAGRSLIQKTGDVLLGTSTVLLARLLTHRTGILGWFPLKLPPLGWTRSATEDNPAEEDPGDKGLDRLGGGLELSVRFAHHEDRDRVVHSARSVGWSPGDLDIQEEGWHDTDESSEEGQQVTVQVDRVCFPLQNAIRVGQTSLDKTARCYVRYKFYDKTAVISKSRRLRPNDANYVVTGMKHKHKTVVQTSSPYQWYLREERLEVQVWVSYGSRRDKDQRSGHRDKLIGSAFIDLDSLCDSHKHLHRISGMYPLFKPGAASLGGGYVRAHVSTEALQRLRDKTSDSEVVPTSEVSSFDIDTDCNTDDSFHHLTTTTNCSSRRKPVGPEPDHGQTFPVHIHIERAMHLPFVTDNNRSKEFCPTTYVTFQSAESSTMMYTPVFPDSVCPSWDYHVDTRLSTELLHAESKNLVFKVWHKSTDSRKSPDKSSDRVLGFVSVDLSPLTSGLQCICGWYNIVNFNGQCKGQIKVNIVPQESLGTSNTGLHTEQSFPSRMPSFYAPGPFVAPRLPSHPSLDLSHFEPRATSIHHNTDPTTRREDGTHWHPTFPVLPVDDSSSKSYLFSSLRKNLQDLDILTESLKQKLTTTETVQNELPRQSGVSMNERLTGLSTISSRGQHDGVLHTNSSAVTLSRSQGESIRTGGDSGAFSGENSYDKVHESTESQAQDSHRSSGHDNHIAEQVLSQSEHLTNMCAGEPATLDSQRSDELTRNDRNNVSPDSGYRNGNFSMSTPRDFQSNPASGAVLQDFTNTLSTLEDTTGNSSATAHGSLKTPRDFSVDHELSQGFVPGQMGCRDVTTEVAERELGSRERVSGDRTAVQTEAVSEGFESNSDEEEDKYGSYRQYKDMLESDVHGVDVDADDEAEEIQMIEPRTLNSVSAMLSSEHRVEVRDADDDGIGGFQQWEESTTGHHRQRPERFDMTAWSRQVHSDESDSEVEARPVGGQTEVTVLSRQVHSDESDSEVEARPVGGQTEVTAQSRQVRGDGSDSEDGAPPVEGPTRLRDPRPQTMVDSWLSENGEIVGTSQGECGERLDSRSRDQQPSRTRRLLSNVELIDTLTSTLSLRHGQSEVNKQQAECLLMEADLDCVTSRKNSSQLSSENSLRNNYQLMNSENSRYSRQSLTMNGENPADFEPHTQQTVISDSRQNMKSCSVQPVGKTDMYKDGGPETMVKLLENDLISPTSSAHSGPHLVNFVTESRSHSQSDTHTDRVTEDSGVESGTKSSQDDKDVSYSSDMTHAPFNKLPDFFLPTENMQACMRALQVAITLPSSYANVPTQQVDKRSLNKVKTASELKEKITTETKARFAAISAKHRPLPTAEEAKRIAKIFSAKLS